jgi:hypothetical protein
MTPSTVRLYRRRCRVSTQVGTGTYRSQSNRIPGGPWSRGWLDSGPRRNLRAANILAVDERCPPCQNEAIQARELTAAGNPLLLRQEG